MNWLRMIRFWVIVVLVFTCGMVSAISAEVKATQLTKEEIQGMYVKFLQKEGYSPEVRANGEIVFKYEGGTYFVVIDPNDRESFFMIGYPNFWEIKDKAEYTKALVAADYSNAKSKVSKIYIVENDVWATAEILVSSPDQFELVYKRAILFIQNGVYNFAQKMRSQ